MSEEAHETKFDVAACLVRVRDQDPSAARELVEHLYPIVIRIARGHLPRRVDEEDLAQEIFMKIFAKLDDYRGTAPFEHWVSRVALNTCLNQLRSEKVRPEWRFADLGEEHAAILEALPSTNEELHPLDASSSCEIVEHLLESLSPQDRMIMRMLELDDLSVDEISRRTGWSNALIRVRAFRARLKLRRRFVSLQEQREKL